MIRWVLMLVVALSSLVAVHPAEASASGRLPVLRRVVTAPLRGVQLLRHRRGHCRCCSAHQHRERLIPERCKQCSDPQ